MFQAKDTTLNPIMAGTFNKKEDLRGNKFNAGYMSSSESISLRLPFYRISKFHTATLHAHRHNQTPLR